MRMTSSEQPKLITVQEHPQIPNLAQVWVRENITEQNKLYTYDEYIFVVPFTETLEEEVTKDLQYWLEMGRKQETPNKASTVQDMLKLFNSIGSTTKQQKEQQKQIEEIQNAIAEVFESINAN